MCGIAGEVSFSNSVIKNKDSFLRMQKVLAPRGPDQNGIYIKDNAALVHSRLCVIDIENGIQPMTTKYGENEYTLVYNGELYNTDEIRDELKLLGHKFVGHSDTEVVLKAYVEWKEKCVEKFNGIFAFGVYEVNNQKLYLCRDRIGVKPLFYTHKNKDFVFNITETEIVLVKEIKSNIDNKDLEKLARSVIDSLGSDVAGQAVVGIGTAVKSIKDLAKSFKEAQVATEVGKFFDTEKIVISYDNLGIARLIYQLPTTLCEMFLKEVFKKGSIESLDHETLFTIQRFFENNLNVSETSRKLFVHRNTLVYRLEKIKKLTGLDLREFDDAIVFKVALMVKKYLDANPVKY